MSLDNLQPPDTQTTTAVARVTNPELRLMPVILGVRLAVHGFRVQTSCDFVLSIHPQKRILILLRQPERNTEDKDQY